MKLSDLRIATRLGLGFGALIVAMIAVAALGTILSNRQAQLTYQTLDVDVQQTFHIIGARAEVANLRRFEKDMLLNLPDLPKVKGYSKRWQEARARLDTHLTAAQVLASDDAERDALQSLAGAMGRYAREMETLEAEMDRGALKGAPEGYKRVAQFRELVRSADEQMNQLFEASLKHLETVKPTLEQNEERRRTAVAVGVVVVLLLALAIATAIARSITRPVREAVRVAEALAQGDLSQKVEVRSKDEMGRLMQALGGTVEQLAGIVGRIKDASDKVNAASREIAQANLDLSTRTEEQASALEETSASMQQMTATVGQNAQNARDANKLAADAATVAGHGGEVVRTAVTTMNGITDASKRIADITGVIDGIAFQTNILALNAAVEAARAGDQGRGFAVVAAEVRSLAQRSAGAAKEIKALITDSAAKVDAGSKQVNDAGRTMEEIVASVGQVSSLISQITKANEEQAQGITQVSEAMTQLEQVTQQNAAMVEEASAAAGSLAEQAGKMSGAVGAFRVEGNLALAPQPPVAPAPAARPVRPSPTLVSSKAKIIRAIGKPAPEHEGWKEF